MTGPTGVLLSRCKKLSPMADHAFPSRLASLPKQRKSMVSHRASYHYDVNRTLIMQFET